DKFIIMYSGNMGLGHHLDILIDLAVVLKSHEEILFLFIGEGAKKNSLQNLVKLNQLNNVKFLTWQTATVLPFSLAAANISVVALEAGATHASVPSKTFNYMAVGSPILGIGNPNTELEKLIKQFQLGFYSEKDSIKEINEFVLELYHNNDLCAQYAQNALQASKNYTHELAKGYVF
ncbi:MAG: glycosyltransferase, partial [Bacteroidia bacterium]